MKKLSWKPKFYGPGFYCSSACGHNCTKAEFDRANFKAKELLKLMRGTGWSIRVHENLGWHYGVHSRYIHVYPVNSYDKIVKYHCLVSDTPGMHGGRADWTVGHNCGTDPNRVVERELRSARSFVDSLEKAVSEAEEEFGGTGYRARVRRSTKGGMVLLNPFWA